VQDRRLGKPATDDLHIDGQALLTCAKPHRDPRQSGNVERYGGTLKIGGIDGLPVDEISHRGVGQGQHHLGHLVHLIFVTGGRLAEGRLHLHDAELVEDVMLK